MKILKKQKNKKGSTLLEILFGISIFILIVVALTLFSRNFWVYTSFISAGLDDADAGRQVIKTMVAEIRKASTANTGAYVINLATASAFTFYSDIDNDTLKEKVRYFLSGNLLQKGVTKPTGSPLTYDVLNEKITTLVSNVTNSSIFDYYDTNYDGSTAPLSSPVAISSIRLIKITITKEKDPNRSPVPVTFSTQVSIRNLKDNL
jgi:type II secretory pathway pseudopilin PulG